MDKFHRIPVKLITRPIEGHVHIYKDYWWAVDRNGCVYFFQPKMLKSLFYYSHPQCNKNIIIANKLIPNDAIATVRLPWAYVPLNMWEYK